LGQKIHSGGNFGWRFFCGLISTTAKPLLLNGFIRLIDNFISLASQLRNPFRPAAFLFTFA